MTDPRDIQQALQEAGDHAGAFLWRRVCRDLDGELRVVVAAREIGTARRLVAQLQEALPAITWTALHLEAQGDPAADPTPTLGAQDRLLGAHVLIWATPLTAALGAWERRALAALEGAGAPHVRAVTLADGHLLDRLSDDPEREGAEVRARVASLLPDGWALLDAADTAPWVARADTERGTVARVRRAAVGHLLLADALRGLDDQVTRAGGDLARAEELLAAEDATVAEARRRGERAAAHLLGAMRRQTQQLLVDLRGFLLQLEADLPGQVDAVEDVDTVRRALAHWLHHVVEAWMADRLGLWRAEVLRDLAEVQLDDSDIDRAELLVPALHPSPVRGDPQWATRLGATAAMGGGAALLLMGLWIPGLMAVTGGLAWSALAQRSQEVATRKKLIETAIDAVRQMSCDAERLLGDQIRQLEEELAHLGEDRARAIADVRAAPRAELEDQRARRSARLDEVAGIRARLVARVDALAHGWEASA